MATSNSSETNFQVPPLRAVVEIIGGELKIFPIADSDADERRILDALRFALMEDDRQ